MTEFNTAKRNYFKNQQDILPTSLEHDTDKYEQFSFYQALGLSDSPKETQTMIRDWFYNNYNYSDAYTKNLSDLWYKWLGENGFNQSSLRDRLKSFYESGIDIVGLLTKFDSLTTVFSTQRLTSVDTDVVRVRRSSDDAEQDFTAAEINNGTVLNYVIPTDVQALYNNAMYFDGVDDGVTLGSNFNWTSTSYVEFVISYFSGAVLSSTDDSNSNRIFIGTNDIISVQINNVTHLFDYVIDKGVLTTIRVTRSGSNLSLYINGELEQTIAGVSTASANMNKIGLKNSGTGVTTGLGLLYDIDLNNQHSYLGNSNTDAGWEDQIGANDGTVSGSPVLFTGQRFAGLVTTQYDQRVPTTKCVMNFDGVNDSVSIGDLGAEDLNYFKTYFYTPVAINNASTSRALFSGDATGDSANTIILGTWTAAVTGEVISIGDNVAISNKRTSVVDMTLAAGVHKLEVQWNTGEGRYDIILDDVMQTVVAGSGGFSDKLTLNTCTLGVRSTGSYMLGSILGVEINSAHSYLGNGNLNENWVDQIGSNDGTVSGSPQRLSNVDYTTVANDMVQTTAALQPKIVTDGVLETVSTKPSIYYDSDYLEIPNTDLLPTTAFTIFAVAKNDNSALSTAQVMSGIYDLNNNRCFQIAINANEKQNIVFGDPANGQFEGSYVSNDALDLENPHIYAFRYDGSLSAANRAKLFRDGVEIAGTIDAGTVPATLYASTAPFVIGTSFNTYPTTSGQWQGQIPTVLYTKTAMTDTEIIAVMGRLNSIYGVY